MAHRALTRRTEGPTRRRAGRNRLTSGPARAALALALTAAAVGGVTAAAVRTAAAAPTRVVSYAGLSVAVPASWPVIDLGAHPHACVRLDRHAVYEGTPGAQQNCPAHLVGRTETVQLLPAVASTVAAAAAGSPVVTAAAGVVPDAAVSAAGHEIDLATAGTGVRLTVTWGQDESLARQIASSVVRHVDTGLTAVARTPVAASQGVPLYPVGASSTMLSGFAFDTCSAPAVATMNAWRRSSYRGVAVYIGGSNRACGDGNLSAGWVHSVVELQRWRLLPIYVGLQAPCADSRFARVATGAATAVRQGGADAADAVSDARRFGLAAGTAVYADMEGYYPSPACTAGVLSYLSGWTAGLHAAGYLAGVYSSGASGIYDLGRAYGDPAYTMPDLIWSARWDGIATTAEPSLPATEWVTHQRVKQYLGDHVENWGGVRMDIDSDYADSAASTVGYSLTVTHATEARRGPGLTAAATAAVAADTTVTGTCWLADPGTATAAWIELTDGSFLARSALDLHGQTPPRCGLLYTTWITVNARTGPGAQHPVVSRIPAGGGAWVVCQGPGLKVRTSIVWDQLRNGSWVSDYWMNTPGASTWSPAIPRC